MKKPASPALFGDEAPVVESSAKKHGFYATDPSDVANFFDFAWHKRGRAIGILPSPEGLRMLDPCSGGSRRHLAPYVEEATSRGVQVVSVDIREDSRADYPGVDFLRLDPLASEVGANAFGLVCSNPDFKAHRPFVVHALKFAPVVAFLLPVDCTRPRKTRFREDVLWWRRYRPRFTVEHDRLCFNGGSGSANQHYAHFVWYAEDVGKPVQPTRSFSVFDWLSL